MASLYVLPLLDELLVVDIKFSLCSYHSQLDSVHEPMINITFLVLCSPQFGCFFFPPLSENLATTSVSLMTLLEQFTWRFTYFSNCWFMYDEAATVVIRGNNLRKGDADGLKYALVHMPNLESLDISDNFIEDDGIRSVGFPFFSHTYFVHSFTDGFTCSSLTVPGV